MYYSEHAAVVTRIWPNLFILQGIYVNFADPSVNHQTFIWYIFILHVWQQRHCVRLLLQYCGLYDLNQVNILPALLPGSYSQRARYVSWLCRSHPKTKKAFQWARLTKIGIIFFNNLERFYISCILSFLRFVNSRTLISSWVILT